MTVSPGKPYPPTMWQRVVYIDHHLLAQVQRWHRPWLTRSMKAFTALANPSGWFFVGFALIAQGTSTRRPALLLGTASILGTIVAQSLKQVSKRARPKDRIQGFQTLADYTDAFSFPSGHTTVAVSVAVALLNEPSALGPLAAAFAAGVGASRVYLGAHFPIDVLAGAALGTIVGYTARVAVGAMM